MREQLIINGEEVDLGNVSISLEYVNNMLTSVDKITSSHSYTISLPRTARNERILDAPTMLDHQSSRVGVYLSAEYWRNGMQIVHNGKAYITSAKGSTIDICLLWDNFAPFMEWVAAGKTIADLGYSNPSWDRVGTLWTSKSSEVVLAYVDSGVDTDTIVCLNLYEMVRKIMDGIGVGWFISSDSPAKTLAQNLVIPCLKFSGSWDATAGQYAMRIDASGNIHLTHRYGINDTAITDTRLNVGNSVKMSFDAENLMLPGRYTTTTPSITIKGIKSDATSVNLGTYYMSTVGYTNPAKLSVHAVLDVSDYSYITISVNGGKNESIINADSSESISVRKYYDTPTHGTEFNIASGAPALKQVDVIKAFCTLFGLAVVTTSNGFIKFVPLSNLSKRDSLYVYDWTDRVVDYGDAMPNKVEYKVGSYARRNLYEYTEDTKDPVYGADGEIYSSSLTNGTEYNAVKLPFAPSDGSIIRYKEVDDSGAAKYIDVKPRIMSMVQYYASSAYRIKLSFNNSLRFDSILPKYYGAISDVVQYPCTITIYMRLSEVDLASLEMDKVVYLGQTGRYYIIGSVKTDNSTDICECELIKL